MRYEYKPGEHNKPRFNKGDIVRFKPDGTVWVIAERLPGMTYSVEGGDSSFSDCLLDSASESDLKYSRQSISMSIKTQ